jgi:VWFA-related protein
MKNSWKTLARRRGNAVRLVLGCLTAMVAFSLAAQGAQKRRTSHHENKRAVPHPKVSSTPVPPVQVCVVVRDRGGRAVGTLRRTDFRLYDDNRYQQIVDFGANLVPLAEADPKVPGTIRYTALYFDDLHYDFTETIRTTDSAYATFGPMVNARNQFGIFTASGEITLNFTSNREQFHKTLLAIRPHLPSPTMAKACPQISDYQAYLLYYLHDPLALKVAFYDMQRCGGPDGAGDPASPRPNLVEMKRMKAVVDGQARKVIAEDETRSTQTLAGLEKLIETVGKLPDPRAIVVASPGFLTGTLGRRVDELSRRATRLHIIVNTLNTAGYVRQIPISASLGRGRAAEEAEGIIDAKNEMRADRAGAISDPLADLATMTGGNFITNIDDLDKGFRLAAPLPAAYYVLGYYPHNLRPNGHFHSVRVALIPRYRMEVQAPAGYFAPGTPPEIAASSLRDRHARRRSRRRRK